MHNYFHSGHENLIVPECPNLGGTWVYKLWLKNTDDTDKTPAFADEDDVRTLTIRQSDCTAIITNPLKFPSNFLIGKVEKQADGYFLSAKWKNGRGI